MNLEPLNEEDWWETWPPVECFVCREHATWQARVQLEKKVPLPLFSHWGDRRWYNTVDSINRMIIGMCAEHKDHAGLLALTQ